MHAIFYHLVINARVDQYFLPVQKKPELTEPTIFVSNAHTFNIIFIDVQINDYNPKLLTLGILKFYFIFNYYFKFVFV